MKTRGVVYAWAGVLILIGILLFIVSNGKLDANTGTQAAISVLQIGVGIVVIEGVIGSALRTEHRARAQHSLSVISGAFRGFDARAAKFIADLGGLDSPRPEERPTFSEAFPAAQEFHPEALESFATWWRSTVDLAQGELRYLANFLEPNEIERLRKPLARSGLEANTLMEIRESSRENADKWAAAMFSLDQLEAEVASIMVAIRAFSQ